MILFTLLNANIRHKSDEKGKINGKTKGIETLIAEKGKNYKKNSFERWCIEISFLNLQTEKTWLSLYHSKY